MRRAAGVLAIAGLGLLASCEDRRVPRVDERANGPRVEERAPAPDANRAGERPAPEGGAR